MQTSFFSHSITRRILGPLVTVSLSLLLLGVWHLTNRAGSPASTKVENTSIEQFQAGPPWRYGRTDARFTLVLYADLECPYCKDYYPLLKGWVDQHPESNLQWHHLPLSMHEPAASQEARLAECAGESGGHTAFWQAVTWIYQQTRSNGAGIPDNTHYPALPPGIQDCLVSTRPDAIVKAQAGQGPRDGVNATPTLRLSDNLNGRSLVLPGPVEGDALLSALDLLATDDEQGKNVEIPANGVSSMPR